MKSVEETRRELFKELCVKIGLPEAAFRCFGEAQGCTGCNDFEDDLVSKCYEIFNVALDSLQITLPKVGDYECRSDIQAVIIGDCHEAIESMNLGIKVK